MIYLEMSRDETHGGGAWAFPKCLWCPKEKVNGSRWPFWDKVLAVKEDDIVLHLRGIPPKAFFVGYSRAVADGYAINEKPPLAGEWASAKTFYRTDLSDYTPFDKPINLAEVFKNRRLQLEKYFEENKNGYIKKNIFFVRQSGRIQCLNGAYLSEVDNDLMAALFGNVSSGINEDNINPEIFVNPVAQSVVTGQQLRTMKARVGQADFARGIKAIYNNRCCFPECKINDSRFLIGAHIARWSDNETLRGQFSNGLCLCIFHDKAFELGLFTLDEKLRIFLNPNEKKGSAVMAQLTLYAGQSITTCDVPPSLDSLLEHWIRFNLDPQ